MNRGTLALFVGGQSRRMAKPKGLLPHPAGGTLLEHAARLAEALSLTPLLVGEAAPYAALMPSVARVADMPRGVGPLGGLAGVLTHVQSGFVLALACDMPFVTAPLLERFLGEESSADVLAARGDTGLWEPLCARYRAERVRPGLQAAIEGGVRSFQTLFARLSVAELRLDESERAQLRDWDTPGDVR